MFGCLTVSSMNAEVCLYVSWGTVCPFCTFWVLSISHNHNTCLLIAYNVKSKHRGDFLSTPWASCAHNFLPSTQLALSSLCLSHIPHCPKNSLATLATFENLPQQQLPSLWSLRRVLAQWKWCLERPQKLLLPLPSFTLFVLCFLHFFFLFFLSSTTQNLFADFLEGHSTEY